MSLLNSDYLTERRNGLKINVSESEIADAVKDSKNKPKAAIAYLLSQGFIFTRIADSFAIAAGGSTFYRNQVEAYVKEGLSKKDAEAKAFQDFRAVAEETQQSSNPSKISQQQASGAGRVILAFANTPMQYARIIKRATQDLINGRGDWKSNVSKIVYYAAIQNLIFNALSNALFALAFSEEEEEQEDKTGRIANGMADSLLRGLGIQGAAVAAVKDALFTILSEYRGGLLLIEDINRYISDHLPNDLVGAICTNRHTDTDIIMHFQSIGRVTSKIWQNINWLRFHKNTDSVDRHIKKFEDKFEYLKIAEMMINKQYYNGNERFFLFVDVDAEKILGDFDKALLNEAIDDYIEKYYRKIISPMLKQRDLKGKIKYNQASAVKFVRDRIIKNYCS